MFVWARKQKAPPKKPRKKTHVTVREAWEKGDLPEGYYIVLMHLNGHVYYLTDLDKTNTAAPSWAWKRQRDAGEAILFRTRQEAMEAAKICRGNIRRKKGYAINKD